MPDAAYQWALIRDLWNQLGLDDCLARDWPAEKRWQLDLLFRRLRALDKLFEEYEDAQLMKELEEEL
jgi:hypothetical protein